MRKKQTKKFFFILFALLISVLLADIVGNHRSFQLSQVIFGQEPSSPEIKPPKKEKKKGGNVPCNRSGRRIRQIEILSAASGTLDISPDYCPDYATGTPVITSKDFFDAQDASASSERHKQNEPASSKSGKKEIHERRPAKDADNRMWAINKDMKIDAGDIRIKLVAIEDKPTIYRFKREDNNEILPFVIDENQPVYVGVKKQAYRMDNDNCDLKPINLPEEYNILTMSSNGEYYAASKYLGKGENIIIILDSAGNHIFEIKNEAPVTPILSNNGELLLYLISDISAYSVKYYDNTGILMNKYNGQMGKGVFSEDSNYSAYFEDCFGECQNASEGVKLNFVDKHGNHIWVKNLMRGLYGTSIYISPDSKYIFASVRDSLSDLLGAFYVFDSKGKPIFSGQTVIPGGFLGGNSSVLFDNNTDLMFIVGKNTILGCALANSQIVWQKEIRTDESDIKMEEGRYEALIIDAAISEKYKKLLLLATTKHYLSSTGSNIVATDLIVYDFNGNQVAKQRLHRYSERSVLALSKDQHKLHYYALNRHFIFDISLKAK